MMSSSQFDDGGGEIFAFVAPESSKVRAGFSLRSSVPNLTRASISSGNRVYRSFKLSLSMSLVSTLVEQTV